MMMNTFKAVLAGGAALLLCMSAEAGVTDRIVAVVNDEVITLSELNGVFEPYQAKIEAAYSGKDRENVVNENRMLLLNRLIDDLLIAQQARKAGIVVTDADVVGAIRDLLRKRDLSPADFQQALDRDGTTLEDYKKGIRDQLMRIGLIQKDIKSKVAVSDEEIGEYYRKNREDYEGNEAVRIKQILFLMPKGGGEAAKEKLRAAAVAIHKRLTNGEPFELISAKYSEGPAASEGGDIGYIEKGVMLPEVEEVALHLPLRQISGVIESTVGFHIIQVIDRRGAGIKPIESVRDEIKDKLERAKMENRFAEWLDALRKKSHIEIKL
jgi:peptidyl-prolyl cis-trans isomerase SurA